MIEWTDEGIVLAARRHGENAAIVTLLTRAHGRHLGLVPGGSGRRARGLYQPGNRLQANWRARLAEHLGHFSCELLASHAAGLLDDRCRLAALAAAVAVVDATLPERQSHLRVFESLAALVDGLAGGASEPEWAARYVCFERDLLADLGFGLDLARCAVTGGTDDLAFVSPNTGRAVSRAAAEPWRDKLLPLPGFLVVAAARPSAPPADILAGLSLTGFFLARHALGSQAADLAGGPRLPAARDRLIAALGRAAP